MGVPWRAEWQEWQRSIPVQSRLSGADSAVLKRIRALHGGLRIMWDVPRQIVTIWQYNSQGIPRKVGDNVFGPYVDNRLYLSLKYGDKRTQEDCRDSVRYEEALHDEFIRRKKRELQLRRQRRSDPEAMAYAVTREMAELDSVPRGIHSHRCAS